MQVVMPLELGIAIEVDEPVRLLIEMTERLDYREPYAAYDRPARADEATPKQLFQLVVLGFMSETYSLQEEAIYPGACALVVPNSAFTLAAFCTSGADTSASRNEKGSP